MNLLKNKKFIGSVFTVIFLGLGIANPEIVASGAIGVYCNVLVKCDA